MEVSWEEKLNWFYKNLQGIEFRERCSKERRTAYRTVYIDMKYTLQRDALKPLCDNTFFAHLYYNYNFFKRLDISEVYSKLMEDCVLVATDQFYSHRRDQ